MLAGGTVKPRPDGQYELELDKEQVAILKWMDRLQAKRQLVVLEPEDIGLMVMVVIPEYQDKAEKKVARLCQGDLAWLKITVRSNWWQMGAEEDGD